MSKILIVGLGNPILGDDGVGWRIAELVSTRLSEAVGTPSPWPSEVFVDVDCLAVGGLSLMERLIGYDYAILIDAIFTGRDPVGTVSWFPIEALPDLSTGHYNSAHDASLKQALQVGSSLGGRLPENITVVVVEAENLFEFSEQLSPSVAAAVPAAVQTVLNLLQEAGYEKFSH